MEYPEGDVIGGGGLEHVAEVARAAERRHEAAVHAQALGHTQTRQCHGFLEPAQRGTCKISFWWQGAEGGREVGGALKGSVLGEVGVVVSRREVEQLVQHTSRPEQLATERKEPAHGEGLQLNRARGDVRR